MNQINNIADNKDVEKILVEASGISDPSAIAAGFIEYQRMGLSKNVYLDSIVCVADADRIYTEFLDDLKEADSTYADQDPDIINLVIDQIEFCNTILLNKCDLLSADKIEQVYKTIRTLQKDADIIQCIQGKVNPDRIFNNKKFVLKKSCSHQEFRSSFQGESRKKFKMSMELLLFCMKKKSHLIMTSLWHFWKMIIRKKSFVQKDMCGFMTMIYMYSFLNRREEMLR